MPVKLQIEFEVIKSQLFCCNLNDTKINWVRKESTKQSITNVDKFVLSHAFKFYLKYNTQYMYEHINIANKNIYRE